ncbi:hypothetical protein [Paenibacillus monticola]|uniref:hypothetical protein n=1 Tax=Paenibacillus monticola TaxID=2666075 RepID=UPI001E3B1BF2|nr:hypothetical protein [Paenibacillus monticola]
MNIKRRWFILIAVASLGALLLQGCGQDTKTEGEGESFASGVETFQETEAAVKSTTVEANTTNGSITPSPVIPERSMPVQEKVPPPVLKPSQDTGALEQVGSSAAESLQIEVQPSPEPSAKTTLKPTSKVVAQSTSGSPQKTEVPVNAKSTDEVTVSSPTDNELITTKDPATTVVSEPSPSKDSSPTSGTTDISWEYFFDGSDQSRPSERFWDLSGSKVTIKGFMGEVLSFDKNWFLLIPEPGAECPFDNGDETYWNKIMIVFVPDDVKLRYTSGPLQITGRLDVGIKIDESGYKTMFRLYDASFKAM